MPDVQGLKIFSPCGRSDQLTPPVRFFHFCVETQQIEWGKHPTSQVTGLEHRRRRSQGKRGGDSSGDPAHLKPEIQESRTEEVLIFESLPLEGPYFLPELHDRVFQYRILDFYR